MSDQLPPLRPSGRGRRRVADSRSQRSVLAASDVAGIVVLGVLGLAVAIVLALVIWHSLFLRDPNAPAAAASASPSATAVPRPSATPTRTTATGTLAGAPYQGKIRPAKVARAHASCGQHGLRTPTKEIVNFQAAQAIDGRPDTAWRCSGNGTGRTLTVTLRSSSKIVAIGLIPGYAGIDPLLGTDAFLRDRRVIRVRWSIGGGTIEQTLQPGDRHLQLLRIPATATDTVTMTILLTTSAGADEFAVSDIAVYAAAG